MHGRARVRLREHERILRAREGAPLWRKLDDARIQPRVAEDAEPGARDAAKGVVPVLGDQVVVVIAQEGEVVVDDPLEQRLRLGQGLGFDRRRALVQVGDDLPRAAGHRRPVLDGGPDVGEHPPEALLHAREVLGVGLADDLGVDERLERAVGGLGVVGEDLEETAALVSAHPDDRVDDQVHAAPQPVQLHAHRVHQEGHVVVDDLDDGVGRRPAVLLELRRVDADARLPARAARAEVQMCEGGAVEVADTPLEQVVGRDEVVVDAEECFEPPCLLRRELGAGVLDRLLDQAGFGLVGLHRHRCHPQSVPREAVCRT